MKVIRSRPEANFTQIWNHVLRDKRLDPMTLGVLCRMLSNRDGWETSADAMWQQARRDRPGNERGEGRRAYRACFALLERTGYLERQRLRTKTGQFETVLILHDQPVETATEIPLTDVPLAVPRSEQEEQDVSAGRNRRTANATSVSGTSSITPSTEHHEKDHQSGSAEPSPRSVPDSGPTQTAPHSQASAADDETKLWTVSQAVWHVYQERIEDEDALRLWQRFLGERQTTKPVKDPVRYLVKIFNDAPNIDSLLSNTPELDDDEGEHVQAHVHDVFCPPECKHCPRCQQMPAMPDSGLCVWCEAELAEQRTGAA